LRNTVLIFGAGANPDNVRGFPSDKRIVVTAENAILDNWIIPRFDIDCRIPALTSVTHAAIFSAMAMGAEPIGLVGIDLSFAGNKSHASGSVFEYDPEFSGGVTVEGIDGRELMSTPQMIADKTQIESVLAKVSTRVINMSKTGAHIMGTEVGSLPDYIENQISNTKQIPEMTDYIDWTPNLDTCEIAPVIGDMTEEITTFVAECRKQKKRIRKIRVVPKKAIKNKKYKKKIGAIIFSYRQFEKRYTRMINMLNSIRLDDMQTEKRQEQGIKKNGRDELIKTVIEEMNLLHDHFHSIGNAGDYLMDILLTECNYYKRIIDFERRGSIGENDDSDIIIYARIHAEYRQLFQAEKIYREYLESFPEDEHAWLELIGLYRAFKLWRPLYQTIAKALETLPDSIVLKENADRTNAQVRELKEIGINLVDKHKHNISMLYLKEYLSIIPNDSEAQAIYKKLQIDVES